MENIKLKPCPFCGGEAKIKATVNNIGLRIWCECSDCEARTMSYHPLKLDRDVTMEDIERSAGLAAEKWNKRAGGTA